MMTDAVERLLGTALPNFVLSPKIFQLRPILRIFEILERTKREKDEVQKLDEVGECGSYCVLLCSFLLMVFALELEAEGFLDFFLLNAVKGGALG